MPRSAERSQERLDYHRDFGQLAVVNVPFVRRVNSSPIRLDLNFVDQVVDRK